MSGEFLRGQTKDCLNLYSSFLICNFGEATYSVELSVIFSDKAFGVTPIEHHVLKAETPPRRLLGLIWSSPIPALKNAYSAAGSLGLLTEAALYYKEEDYETTFSVQEVGLVRSTSTAVSIGLFLFLLSAEVL